MTAFNKHDNLFKYEIEYSYTVKAALEEIEEKIPCRKTAWFCAVLCTTGIPCSHLRSPESKSFYRTFYTPSMWYWSRARNSGFLFLWFPFSSDRVKIID